MPRINLLVLCVVRRLLELFLLWFLLCNSFLVSEIGEVQMFIQVLLVGFIQGVNKNAIVAISVVLNI